MVARVGLLFACIVAACLVVAGCGKDETPPEVKRAEAALRAGTAGDNKRAIMDFVEQEGLPGLKRLLGAESASVRMFALTGLGTLKGNAEATQLLIGVANGEDSSDAYWAIAALGYQGAKEAKELIQKAMEGQDARRRAGACIAIKEYGDESLYPLLDAALNDEDPEVRRTADKMKLLVTQGQVVKDGKAVDSGEADPQQK